MRRERWWIKRDRKRSERAGLDPERFFAEDYPRAVANNLQIYGGLSGRIAIAVRGVGEWTLHLGDVEQPVSGSFDREAQTRVCFVPTAFGDFLRGSLDVKRAMSRGAITVQGDAALIVSLGRILNPARSILQTRAGEGNGHAKRNR